VVDVEVMVASRGMSLSQEYSRTPPRSEYVLTDKGAELCDLLLVMSHVELRCSACDQPMSVRTIDVLPGPGREAVVTQA
jgi:DNA-binding HxlR family transcriptional regulator